MTDRIRILLVDDHALVREGIRSLLQLQPDIEVVGEAGDGMEGIRKTGDLCPDVVVMDISMPSLGGIEATRRIVRDFPETRVVVLSRHGDVSYARSVLEAGASGFVPKKAVSTELAEAIRSVHAGGVYLHPSVAGGVARDYVRLVRSEEKTSGDGLSDREKEILKLIGEGYSSHHIASRLYLSVKTVLNHRHNIMQKLHVENHAQLIKCAVTMGLVEDDEPPIP